MDNTKTASNGFPLFNVKESEKNEDWYKQCITAITNRSLNQTYSMNYTMMNQNVQFFQGINQGDEYAFLQHSEDGEVLPAKWMNINRIASKLKIVIGEFMTRGYSIDVKALNKEAVSRRLEEKNRIVTEMRLQPFAAALEQESGLPFQSEEPIPQDEDELEDYIESWKDRSEFVMESALKWLAKEFDWEAERSYMFRDILIMGRAFGKVELFRGLPRIRRIDPRLMIFDTNATDDLLTDSTYWGEVHYMPIAKATEKYGLTQKEKEDIFTSSKDNNHVNFLGTISPDLPVNKDNDILFYKQDGGDLRVLVVTAYWQDTMPYVQKESKDKHGNVHLKKENPDYDGADSKKKMVKIWRQGTLVGGKILKEHGIMENMLRDTEHNKLGEACPPYIGLVPFYYNGHGISLVQQLRSLQDLKNITAYCIQLAMSRAGTKSLVYDQSQLPEGWTEETMLKWLKTVGIVFIDSQVSGMPSNYNQFNQIDLSISESVKQYIEILAWIDREMNAVSGINEAREGIAQGASQAVGVTQSALFQSNLTTAPLFKMFNRFVSRAFTYQAKLVKLTWRDPERYAPIIGDTGVDFINEDIELDLDDYGVFIEETPAIVDDLQTYQALIQAAVQAGGLPFIDAMKLLMEKDVKVGIRRYERALRRQEQKMMQQAQAEEQAKAEQAAMIEQTKQQTQREKAQADYNKQLISNQGQLENTLTKGRLDLAGKKIDILSK